MAKARVLKVVNYRQEDLQKLELLETILKREGKEYSEWVREQTERYVKAHASGNPVMQLDKFRDSKFVAIPTMGEMLTPERLDCLEIKDLEEWHFHARARTQEIEAALQRRRERLQGKQH